MKTVVQIMRDKGWTVALAAPTGRAAQRLSELSGARCEDVGAQGGYTRRPRPFICSTREFDLCCCLPNLTTETPLLHAGVDAPQEQAQATTIHRLLEYKPPGGFTRNENNPIDADAVVVDEASMLDITLARDLCSALSPKTRLILIGDPDQLPSIGAGNVRIVSQ